MLLDPLYNSPYLLSKWMLLMDNPIWNKRQLVILHLRPGLPCLQILIPFPWYKECPCRKKRPSQSWQLHARAQKDTAQRHKSSWHDPVLSDKSKKVWVGMRIFFPVRIEMHRNEEICFCVCVHLWGATYSVAELNNCIICIQIWI